MSKVCIKNKQKKNTEKDQIKLEEAIIPINKVSCDVIRKLQTEPYPQLTLSTYSTISEAAQLYFNQYIKLFNQNQTLNDELASILHQRNQLAQQYNQIKKMKSFDDNVRRRRRYASQIQRNYHCPMPKCNKGYGSQGSLTHHVRLKHPKFFQSGDYQLYLQSYVLPKQTKEQMKKQVIVIEQEQDSSQKQLNRKRTKKQERVKNLILRKQQITRRQYPEQQSKIDERKIFQQNQKRNDEMINQYIGQLDPNQ